MPRTATRLPEIGTAWARPSSVEDACGLLAEAAGAGRPVAGCTALTPFALAADRTIRVAVDLTALPELATIEEGEADLWIGATVTIQALAASELLRERAPMLAQAAAGIGDEVLRGMATIGGNVATRVAAPLELPIVLAALGASIEIASSQGTRAVSASELADPELRFEYDEMIVAVHVPASDGASWAYRKLTTNLRSFGVACLALSAPPSGGPAAFAGVGTPFPQRLPAVERALAATESCDAAGVAAEACEGLVGAADPLASGTYRLRGLRALLEEELRRLDGVAE